MVRYSKHERRVNLSDAMEGPRRYYDFNYLLKPAERASTQEAQKELSVELVRLGKEGREIINSCFVNALTISGDIQYENNIAANLYVSTEKEIDLFNERSLVFTDTFEFASHVRKSLSPHAASEMIYAKLFDFEMFLLKQRKLRREQKKSA